MNFLFSVIVGTIGAYVGMQLCKTTTSAWWAGIITGIFITLVQNLN